MYDSLLFLAYLRKFSEIFYWALFTKLVFKSATVHTHQVASN
jgi:hypothetical protein